MNPRLSLQRLPSDPHCPKASSAKKKKEREIENRKRKVFAPLL